MCKDLEEGPGLRAHLHQMPTIQVEDDVAGGPLTSTAGTRRALRVHRIGFYWPAPG
jgi:hypothetical protein